MLQYLRGYRGNDAMTAQLQWFFVGPLKNRSLRKNRNYLKNQQGFTLVEIMVAMTLMVIALFALVGMQIVALKSNNIANQLSVATSLASEALEDISSTTWSSNGTALTNGTTTINFGSSTSGNYGQYTDPSAGGLYTITCTPTLNSPISGIAQLDVTVTYTYKGISKSVTISSYKRLV
jgi:prepilin-type N-terminal cleavage/methylation domain-containing protein